MKWAEFRVQPDAMDKIVDALRHGKTLTGIARECGTVVVNVWQWINRSPSRRTAYDAVKLPRGRPTKLDAAGKVAASAKHRHGSITATASFLGVTRGTMWNWGARRVT